MYQGYLVCKRTEKTNLFQPLFPQWSKQRPQETAGIYTARDKYGCPEKMVEYAIAGMDNNLFVSTYMLQLPDKATLEKFLRDEIKDVDE